MLITFRDEKRYTHTHDSNVPRAVAIEGEHNGLDIGFICAWEKPLYVRDLYVDGEPRIERVFVPPGGMLVFQAGKLLEYEAKPVPHWAPDKLANTPSTEMRGPLPMAWASDKFGNSPGGYGINPYHAD